MSKMLLAATCGLCFFAQAATATPATYGNPDGCEFYKDGELNTGEEMLVNPSEIREYESVCTIPQPADFSGKPITVACAEGDKEWTAVVTLTMQPPATLIYKDSVGEVVLSRCD